MFKKLTLAAAAGAGYVLGTKAGHQRYEQIVGKFREIAGMPAVQNATATVQETAAPLVDKAKGTVTEKISSVTDKAGGGGSSSGGRSSSGSRSSSASGTGATTRSTAAAGAAPSGTAPVTPRA